MDEFRDFEKYVKGVDPYGMQSGIVLIDPPEEWYVSPSGLLCLASNKVCGELTARQEARS